MDISARLESLSENQRRLLALRVQEHLNNGEDPAGAQHPRRLVAYVAPQAPGGVREEELRQLVKEKLPAHMVPGAFVVLDALPRTPNGKVDRRALPAPVKPGKPVRTASPGADGTPGAPADLLERQLTQVWEKVLGVRHIGVHDDFFDLGGHSLLALVLMDQIEKVAGQKLPLAALLQAPTIGQLAALLRDRGWTPPGQSLVPIRSGGSRPPLFCVHARGGNVLFYGDLARHLGSDQPVYGLQALGLDGKQDPLTRVEDMAAHYVREVRAVQPEGPYYLVGRCFGSKIALEMALRFQAAGQEVALLGILDSEPPRPEPPPGPGTRQPKTPAYFLRRSVYHLQRGQLFTLLKTNFTKTTAYLFSAEAKYMQRIWEANGNAGRYYDPEGVFDGPITLFRSEELNVSRPHDWHVEGWSEFAGGGLICRVLDGTTHKSIIQEPDVRLLAEQLKPHLGSTRAAGVPGAVRTAGLVAG
jgi:thioesterase domain-containing protein/acyl carrier protein